MRKLDIMNMREGEEWILVDGKEARIEKKVIVIKDSVNKEAVEVILKAAKKVNKKIKEVKNGKK